jgi:transcriptional regulator with XRE-family HTH domain
MKSRAVEGFGQRLAKFRKSKGLTQTELGELVKVSKRVIAYYETEGGQPPGAMLAELAGHLGVGVDALLGTKAHATSPDPTTARLLKKLEIVRKLPAEDQKTVLRLVETLASARGI